MQEYLLLNQEKKQLLDQAKVIAVVGLSDNPQRPSNRIGRYLQKEGYKVIPVNPLLQEVLGEKSYPDLKSVPEKIDIVDIFRRSEEVHAIVEEAQELQIPAIWVQVGIECSDDTIELVKANNMKLIKDCCIMVDHRQLKG